MEASHVSALQTKHASIEKDLRVELNRPLPNEAMVQRLKRQKLRIKDEIAQT